MSTAQRDATEPSKVPVAPNDPLYGEVLDFLYTEAELLDEERLEEWLGMMDESLSYRMPVRVTVARGEGPGFDPEASFFDDDLVTLGLRVRRVLDSPNAHAEMPPTRARRFVTNVRVATSGDDVLACSSLLLLRSRWDASSFEFLAGRRNDVLRHAGDSLKLIAREILIDQTVPASPNLSVFL